MGLIAGALAAHTGKGKAALLHPRAGFGSRGPAELVGNLNIPQIQYAAAAAANKMNMGVGVSIEALDAVDISQTDDFPLLIEQSQIPINRSQ